MKNDLTPDDYRALAEFRYLLRHFLQFSEQAAKKLGLQPQQHQLLLALKGFPEGKPTIGGLAARLHLRHHSAVELVNRLAQRGYIRRIPSTVDRRQVLVEITAAGERTLRKLSLSHRLELQSVASPLIKALQELINET